MLLGMSSEDVQERTQEEENYRLFLIALVKGALVDIRMNIKRELTLEWMRLSADIDFSFRWCLNQIAGRALSESEYRTIVARVSSRKFCIDHVSQGVKSQFRVLSAEKRGHINYPKKRRKRRERDW